MKEKHCKILDSCIYSLNLVTYVGNAQKKSCLVHEKSKRASWRIFFHSGKGKYANV